MTHRKRRRTVKAAVFVIVAVAVSLLGASALTAANTVPPSKAGDGAGAITGYLVTNVDYQLDPINPQNISQVSFTLDSVPALTSDIQIRLDSTSVVWYTCTNIAADVTCPTPGASVESADELRVVAVD